jgi:hypothetical protein
MFGASHDQMNRKVGESQPLTSSSHEINHARWWSG